MKRLVAGALASALALTASGGQASTFFEEEMRCPVGGKTFTATVQGSSTSFGQRPDGKRYSTVLAPPPECPDNGFVFYKETYSPTEQAKLTGLVQSADYARLRREENVHYRRYWLMKHMDQPVDAVGEALLVASWNSDDRPEAKARDQREFVALVAALPSGTKDLFWFRARAADLLRELGEHQRSDDMIVALKGQLPTVTDPEERGLWSGFFEAQRLLNAERNKASEPVTLVPPMIAAKLCVDAERPFSNSERTRCGAAELRADIERYRSMKAREASTPPR